MPKNANAFLVPQSMHIDVFTALAASSLVVFLPGLVMLMLRTGSSNYRWLDAWATSFCLFGIGDFATTIRVGADERLEGQIGNILILVGFGLIWTAMRRFEGRQPRPALVFAPPVIWFLLGQIPGFSQSLAARVVVLSIFAALFIGLAAWETWRGRNEPLPSRPIVTGLLAAGALLFAMRVPLAPFAPYPFGGQPEDGVAMAAFNGMIIVLAVSITILLISMTMERSENKQRALAATDPLTGLLNRRGLDLICPDGRLPAGAALILFDFDRFKQINDAFGHAAGDLMIKAFAQICREELRQIDHGVRLGGEEFALVLSQADEKTTRAMAERIRQRFGEHVEPIEGGALACTVSGGYCCFPQDRRIWLSAAIACVDRAMYLAKGAGRNRVRGTKVDMLPGASSEKGHVTPQKWSAVV